MSRPFGDTAIVVCKNLANRCSWISTGSLSIYEK